MNKQLILSFTKKSLRLVKIYLLIVICLVPIIFVIFYGSLIIYQSFYYSTFLPHELGHTYYYLYLNKSSNPNINCSLKDICIKFGEAEFRLIFTKITIFHPITTHTEVYETPCTNTKFHCFSGFFFGAVPYIIIIWLITKYLLKKQFKKDKYKIKHLLLDSFFIFFLTENYIENLVTGNDAQCFYGKALFTQLFDHSTLKVINILILVGFLFSLFYQRVIKILQKIIIRNINKKD